MRLIIFKDTVGEWRFRLRADNEEIIAVSEGYENLGDCKHTVMMIQIGSVGATVEVEEVLAEWELVGDEQPAEQGPEGELLESSDLTSDE